MITRVIAGVVLLLSLFSIALCAPWDWSQVAIGGGGYVDGLIVHPKEKDLVYIRCDVGGIYRFDFTGEVWIPLIDMFGPDQKNFYGGDSIAIDPNDPDILYMAAGMYDYWGNGDVIKSTDRGETWEFTNLNLLMGANQEVRFAGERLMVNPLNSNELYYGSRYDGLWLKNGTTAWKRIESLPSNGTLSYGVVFVIFDSPVMYAGVYGEGIFISRDNAVTWKLLEGSPSQMIRAIVPTPGTLIVTSLFGVLKYSNNNWTDISPVPQVEYSAVTVHPTNPDFMIVAIREADVLLGVYRTWDGAKSWENLTPNATAIQDVPWWPDNWFASATAVVVIDPIQPLRAYMTTWYGVYFCDNITSEKTTWYTKEMGHEEMFALVLHAPSSGGVVTGVADVNGFVISDTTRFPDFNFGTYTDFTIQDTDSMDSAEYLPNLIVRVGTLNTVTPRVGGGGYSTDGGKTWSKFPTYPVTNNYPFGGAIAISADGKTIIWWPFQSEAFYSADMGATWTPAKGTPFNNNSCCGAELGASNLGINFGYSLALCADRSNATVFYTFNVLDGAFAISSDGGRTFTNASTIPSWDPTFNNVNVKSVPGNAGHVWVSLGDAGLWRSTNYGRTFTKISDIQRSLIFAFGKAAPATNYPAVYILGTIGNITSVFTSSDIGQTWTNIGSQTIGLGDNPWSMAADMTEYGRLFVGTLGRGVYVANV